MPAICQQIDAATKRGIIRATRHELASAFPAADLPRSCLQSTLCFLRHLYAATGIKAQLQAGTMSWRCVAPEHDDGGITHYSFIWSPRNAASIRSVANGGLPEIHIWAAIIETQEIIDLQKRYFPALLREAIPGKIWSAPKPPDFLWCSSDSRPDCIYKPEIAAINFAYRLIAKARDGD